MKICCLRILPFIFLLGLVACGGGSGGGGSTTITKTTPTITWATPAAITFGTALSSTQLNATANVAGTFVYAPIAGTVPLVGTDTLSVTFTPTDTIDYTTATATVQLVVNAVVVSLPTVTITASPSTITVGDSTTLTWNCTNSTSATASGAWSGTEAMSGSTSETPVATGTETYSLDCTGVGGSATASATVTVNAVPLPDITATSIPGNVLYTDWSKIAILGVSFAVSNSASTDVLYPTDFNNVDASAVSSTGATAELDFGSRFSSPGWLTFAVCENANNTDCGTSQSIAFLGAQNYLAASSSGELFFLDQTQGSSGLNGYVRKYKADGTADGSFFVGQGLPCIAVDDKTGLLVIGGGNDNEDGSPTYIAPQGFLTGAVATACAAENGYTGFIQAANNSVSFYDLTGGIGSQPTVHNALNLGTMPWAIAMATFGTETGAYVVSADGTPSLYKVRASDAYSGEEPALPLPGITPLSTVKKATIYSGGLQVVVFDSGPASGTVAVLSTYDQLLLFVDVNTWTVTKSIPLSGTPFRITTDAAGGRVLVEFADPANKVSTYAWVDALSGEVTPSPLTSPLLGVGVYYDGTNIIPAMRNQPSLQLLH